MLSVKKLHDDLDYWIHLGLGNDIINSPEQRQEYRHLVRDAVRLWQADEENLDKSLYIDTTELKNQFIVQHSLLSLKRELEKPWYLQPTFYRLLWLHVKNWYFRGR